MKAELIKALKDATAGSPEAERQAMALVTSYISLIDSTLADLQARVTQLESAALGDAVDSMTRLETKVQNNEQF